ncbi:MAG: altronate dehydratase [Clostridia bacterium]|nr:altronate dehydratase [Clostridia bacterium]
MKSCMTIHPKDDVAVALRDLEAGSLAEGICLAENIPAGHKFSRRPIAAGEEIRKYGEVIGRAAADIPAGAHVHSHNLKSILAGAQSYAYTPRECPLSPAQYPGFMGYRRPDGAVGVRNEIWIIPTVGCVNAVAAEIEKRCAKYAVGSVERVVAYNHPYGCSQLSGDHEMTRRFLCALINHPNAGAVLVLGLGCENNHIAGMQECLGSWDEGRVAFLNCQEAEDELSAAEQIIARLAAYAGGFRREPCDASELVIGLKCGGSDGFSGISANPLLGRFSDGLIAAGGSAILTEVPEMFGAEHLLMARCADRSVFEKCVDMVNGFKDYFLRYGEGVDENPSPGNRAGGITTLAEKSLGCTQKGGTAPVTDVIGYGERIKERGLTLLSAPGNDLVAACALAAAGAHIVLFTTGRGTPFGCPVPTVKIASNTPLFEKKRAWMDFDAGCLLQGADPAETAHRFAAYVLSVASGERPASEKLSKGDLAIFKDGVTL